MHNSAVYVVDDEPIVLMDIVSILWWELQVKIYAFDDTIFSLSKIRRSEPAILLTDIQVGSGSGLDLARQARRLHPQLPVVFMTAYPDRFLGDTSKEKVDEADHINYIITKPFMNESVLAILGTALSNSQRRVFRAAPNDAPTVFTDGKVDTRFDFTA